MSTDRAGRLTVPLPGRTYRQRTAQDDYLGTERRFHETEGREIVPFLTFAADDATPDVTGGKNFRTANANATTITDFDGGVDGQEIVVKIDDGNTTIDFTASGLTGNGGVDWSPSDGDHMRCVYDGLDGVWLCEVSDNTA